MLSPSSFHQELSIIHVSRSWAPSPPPALSGKGVIWAEPSLAYATRVQRGEWWLPQNRSMFDAGLSALPSFTRTWGQDSYPLSEAHPTPRLASTEVQFVYPLPENGRQSLRAYRWGDTQQCSIFPGNSLGAGVTINWKRERRKGAKDLERMH